MKNSFQDHALGIPTESGAYTAEKCPGRQVSTRDVLPFSPFCIPIRGNRQSKQKWMNKVGKRADDLAQGVCEHVRLGPNISETVKSKLSLGARILQRGGVDKVFRQIFSVREGEKLLKACQCYLSTTAGPIAGLLFTSTEKIAFCSERSLTFASPSGELIKVPYKVLIPLRQISRVDPSENVHRPTQKHVCILTVDDFEFWFMGFVNYQKAFKYLQKAVSQSPVD